MNPRRRHASPRLSWLLGLLVLVPGLRAGATVLVETDVPVLAASADLAVRGRVLREASRWDASRKRIYTDVVILVDEVYKGDARQGQEIVVTRLGGSVAGIGMRVAGEASFFPGEEAVLFLRRHPATDHPARRVPRLTVLGMAQGKLPVIRDAHGAWVLCSRGSTGARLVRRASGDTLEPGTGRPRFVPLSELVKEIRRAGTAGPTDRRRP